jgi:hypothetical protein
MGLNFRVGLPGPFAYSTRVTPRRRRHTNGGGGPAVLVLIALWLLFMHPLAVLGAGAVLLIVFAVASKFRD